ncbi:hypothetical protein BHM03_00019430 [Ensete ventricosum]|uniref:Uncharacterized protein n=1 Tax=Ensete ventricosum TaxID=4639 RepID=A0A445MFR8_ENSVE|nr:hypothetical protein BHM03_00019430 [Ensete ventricosum]
MHYVVDRLGLFLYGFLFGFKAFFRWFTFLILHWFNHEELALFAAMFVAPRFIAMPTQSFGRSFVKLVSRQFFWCGSSDGSRGGSRPRMVGRGVTLILRASWFNRSSWICVKEITAIRKPFLEPLPKESSMGMFKPIKPLNSISLEVYGSDLHPCGIGVSVEPKIALRAQDPSDRVSFFPSWEVNLHAWIVGIRHDMSMLLRIISVI